MNRRAAIPAQKLFNPGPFVKPLPGWRLRKRRGRRISGRQRSFFPLGRSSFRDKRNCFRGEGSCFRRPGSAFQGKRNSFHDKRSFFRVGRSSFGCRRNCFCIERSCRRGGRSSFHLERSSFSGVSAPPSFPSCPWQRGKGRLPTLEGNSYSQRHEHRARPHRVALPLALGPAQARPSSLRTGTSSAKSRRRRRPRGHQFPNSRRLGGRSSGGLTGFKQPDTVARCPAKYAS